MNIQNLQFSIFRILQHFASNYVMLFPAVNKDTFEFCLNQIFVFQSEYTKTRISRLRGAVTYGNRQGSRTKSKG